MSFSAVAKVTRARVTRAFILGSAIIAETFVLSFTSVSAVTHASTSSHPGITKKAVVVVGPVESTTSKYIGYADKISAALTAGGITVTKIYAPNATWSAVQAAATGADFFAYLGHGNGWPSIHPPFQEDSKDGLGLDASAGSMTVKYYGACYLLGGINQMPSCTKDKDYGTGIRLAPNAIVLLNHNCYAEGNADTDTSPPDEATAIQRIDNAASGWLRVGARTVFALGWQPGEQIVNWLATGHMTMDAMFMLRDGANADPNFLPYHGWVGYDPDLYVDSVRIPGQTLHIDPDLDPAHPNGYLRALSGDMSFTTDEWWNGSSSDDTTPPDLTGLDAAPVTNITPADADVPVFTPNADGVGDTLTVEHTLSEASYLDYAIKDSDGNVVKTFTTYSPEGDTTDTWDGTTNAGTVVPDGTYRIEITPKDVAGNVGEMKHTAVMVLTMMRAPKAAPAFFFPSDGDTLSATQKQSVILDEPANLTWVVLNKSGVPVRTVMTNQAKPAGKVTFTWDGKNDAGVYVPNGAYTMAITAASGVGAYTQQVALTLGPVQMTGVTVGTAGTTMKLTFLFAESQKGWPKLKVTQPGVPAYTVSLLKYTDTKFTATWKLKAGGTPGKVTLTLTGTDVNGGTWKQKLSATIQ